jgi:tellurite resistance-related uncharacterized protein
MTKLPDGATLLRDLGELDQKSVPAGLLKDHSLKQGVWGMLEVLSGELQFVWADDNVTDRDLVSGDVVIIPPQALHHLVPGAAFEIKLALYRATD